MKLCTIGFTKTSAEHFFSRLQQSGVTRVIDVRLDNTSQLAGFAKKDDLRYFLRSICGIGYVHRPELAPTKEMLGEYRTHGDWAEYERQFIALMDSRRIDERIPRDLVEGACLLCSEHAPHRCHRRLVAEYLAAKWGDAEVVHL